MAIYFVVDMKSFYASVECVLRGLDPLETSLVVADESKGKGTICLAISPKMKSLGVKNRCRLFEIEIKDFIIAKPQMKKYIEFSADIYGVLLKLFDKKDIFVYSIDECFIDVTSYLKFFKIDKFKLAQKVIFSIKEETGIPAAVGIGTNLFLAKVALDICAKKQKDFVAFLDEELFKKHLWHHRPLKDFWQISTGISSRLAKFAIYDMFALAHFNYNSLKREFGINAELLFDHAWGKESCTIADIKSYERKSHSLSSNQVLSKPYFYDDAFLVLKEMVENLCLDMTRKKLVASVVHLRISYQDKTASSASKKMDVTTNLYSFVFPFFRNLFNKMVDTKKLIRKIGISFSHVVSEDFEQYLLFHDRKEILRQKKLAKMVVSVHDKFGKNSLLKGNSLLENATQRERNKLVGGHSA